MLDLMRQANRRKWFVWIVIMFVVSAFVISIFMIWGGAATRGATGGTQSWVVRVNDVEISAFDVDRLRGQVENQYRQILGAQFEQQASQIDFNQIALRELLKQALAYSEAERLGLKPTEPEVADAIVSAPVFQRNGRFIGRAQYLQELRGRGYDVGTYESDVARDLAVDKLRDLLGTMVTVNDLEVEKAYAEDGQSAEVDYVFFKQSDYPVTGEPTAREIQSWYTDHRSSYLTPEKRRAAYVLIERDPIQKTVEVSDTETRDDYEKNKETMYKHPEERRASHILVKVGAETKPEEAEAAKTKAEAILARARAGEDFAKLAKETSDDTASAQDGGDLGWFGTGRMVPEFEKAAFALSEGQISDLVRSPFGFHIIKSTGSRPAGYRPFEEVRDQIRQQLSFRKGQELLSKKADELAAKLGQQAAGFEKTAGEMGLTVKDTGFLAKTDPIPEMGPMPQLSEEVFRLNKDEHTAAVPSPRGIVFARLIDVQQPTPAPFDTVKDRVKADVTQSRSLERARAAAAEVAAGGASGISFKEAADKKKAEIKSSGEFTRSSAPADFNDAVKTAIFSHKANDLIGPMETSGGVVVAKIIKRGPETTEDVARVKAGTRQQLLSRKKEEAFVALLQRLQHAAQIEYNQSALENLRRGGPRPAR